MINERIKRFNRELLKAIKEDDLVRLVISSPAYTEAELRSISGKLITTGKGDFLSLVFRNKTNDVTKNYKRGEVTELMEKLLSEDFFQAEMQTSSTRWHLALNAGPNGKLKSKEIEAEVDKDRSHDKKKNRLITGSSYLISLGIANEDGSIKPSKQDKYKQINRYVEIMEGILSSVELGDSFSVADMGSGKGYLTFALYDHLTNNKGKSGKMVGVEVRKDLIDKCNSIASNSGFKRLKFIEGSIKDSDLPEIDVLIALHACDTATDDAIFRGVTSKAKVIVVAPCCHKQVRKDLKTEGDLSSITQHGILKERQAELLTDGIRALLLEAHGYKTKVFEFIETEHTPKNVLIVGTLDSPVEKANDEVLAKIESVKAIHGLSNHYLESLLIKGN
ncbi:MAG: hypothetical protein ACI9FU_000258 [Granulosicoccus sp.]|jgi:hypothetical protein